MYLLSLQTADPPTAFTQQECLEVFLESEVRKRLKPRSGELLEKVLSGDSGIDTRRFCYTDLSGIFDLGPEDLNRIFEREASRLGGAALEKALRESGLTHDELDGLVVCTCTGYVCPGLSSFIAEQVGLRDDCELIDLVGMGCGAAIPSLRVVHQQLAADPQRKIAMIAVEICSAAFYLDDDPGVLISACLFGDGAAASIWTGQPPEFPSWMAGNFDSLHLPEKRPFLRFVNSNGALKNKLSIRVPAEAGNAVRTLWERALARGLDPATPILPHTGGRDVMDALEQRFEGRHFTESRKILRRHGNMSSPSVLYVLQEYLRRQGDPDGPLWLTSFGAGFSAYSMVLEPVTRNP